MNSDPYQPIACGDYDIYEIAIMRGQQLDLQWQDTRDGPQAARVTPIGLETRAGEEYLLCSYAPRDETVMKIRLDKVTSRKIVGA